MNQCWSIIKIRLKLLKNYAILYKNQKIDQVWWTYSKQIPKITWTKIKLKLKSDQNPNKYKKIVSIWYTIMITNRMIRKWLEVVHTVLYRDENGIED